MMEPNTGDDRKAMARKQLRLLIARGELAEARAERLLSSCAAEAAEIRTGSDQLLLDRHAWRTSTLLQTERMLQSELPGEVDLADTFERFSTRFLMSSDLLTELRTSTAAVLVGGEICRWIMLVAHELLHAVESAADPNHGCKAAIAIDHRAHGLVLRVMSVDGSARPVPSRSGVVALGRVREIMALLGGFEAAVEGRDVSYEVTFLGGRVSAGS